MPNLSISSIPVRPQRRTKTSDVVLVLCALMLPFMPGCMLLQNHCRRQPECTPACQPLPRTNLAFREFGELPPARFPNTEGHWTLQPVMFNEDMLVRPLTLAQSRDLAVATNPGAVSLQQEAARYSRTSNSSNTITQILQMQAAQVRNDTAADSMTGWFNLLKVMLQHDVLMQSAEQLEETEKTVARLREAGQAMTFDLGKFERQKNEQDDQQSVLAAGQQDLEGLLQMMLQISPDTNHPIMCDARGLESWRPATAPDEQSAIALALDNRQDLAILVRLSESQDVRTLEATRQALKEVHPLIASAINRSFGGGPFKLLRLKYQLGKELESRRQQICEVVELTRDKIRLQVNESLHAIERHEAGVRLRQASIASIDASLKLLDRASAVRTVELQELTDLKTKRLELQSELVDQMVLRELAWIRLYKSQGLLSGPNTECICHLPD